MDDERKKKRGQTLAPTPLVALLNLLHVVVGGVCTFGAYVVVHSLLPLVIFLSMGVLARFHDYCWLTKVTQAIESAPDSCKDEDVHPHAPFLNRFMEGSIDEDIGGRVFRNGQALLIAVNVCAAVYRLSDHYNFALLPRRGHDRLVPVVLVVLVAAWLSSEVYIHTVYEEKPFCDACDHHKGDEPVPMFTPLTSFLQ
jgi:hypothetical protein